MLLPVCPKCGCIPSGVRPGGRCPACGGTLAAGALAGVPPDPPDGDPSPTPPWRRERVGTMIGSLAGVGAGLIGGWWAGLGAAQDAARFALAAGLVTGLVAGGLAGAVVARLTARPPG